MLWPAVSGWLVAMVSQVSFAQETATRPIRLPRSSVTTLAVKPAAVKLSSSRGSASSATSLGPIELPQTIQPPTPDVPAAVYQLSRPNPMGGALLDPYRGRVLDEDASTDEPSSSGRIDGLAPIPESDSFHLWWQDALTQPLGMSGRTVPVDVTWLTQTALESSPLVRSLLTRPQTDQTGIVIADAEFDPSVYLEGKFVDTDEPIGSLLQTGRVDGRYLDETFSADAGLVRRLRGGGNFEAVQRGGFQSNNSDFLVPNPQGTTRLELNYAQPLLKDRGRSVNQIRVVLATIDLRLTRSEVRQELEKHLTAVTQAYWDLYKARAEWLQRTRLLQRAERLHAIVRARQGVDSMRRQLLRAESALADRRTGLRRSEADIRDAQTRLRMLTGSDLLTQSIDLELTPQELPSRSAIEIKNRSAAITALENRADLDLAIQRIRSTSAKVGVARNQVLPRLDLLLTTYVAGLDSRRDTFGAFVNQFSRGAPTYAAGLRWELPVGNRAARARLTRNRWEWTRAMEDFRQTTEAALSQVEIATRDTRTTHQEMVAKYQSIRAAAREVDYLQQRYETLVNPQESAIVLIEDLLDAQRRLFNAESDFVAAQIAYAMSWVNLRRSMGVLLRMDATSREDWAGSGDALTESMEVADIDPLIGSEVVIDDDFQTSPGAP